MAQGPPLDPEIQEVEELGRIERRKDAREPVRAGRTVLIAALVVAVAVTALLWIAYR